MMERAKIIGLIVVLLAMGQLAAGAETHQLEDLKTLDVQLQVLYRQGKYAEAIPIAEKSLALTEKYYGPEHPKTAIALNNLAELYIVKKRYHEAESLSQRALEIYRNSLGPSAPNPNVLKSLRHLQEIYEKTGQPAKAKKYHRQAIVTEMQLAREYSHYALQQQRDYYGLKQQRHYKRYRSSKKTAKKPGEVAAYWNTWFENPANDKRAVVLETGNYYTFVLDLSRFAYFKGYAAPIGSSVQKEIAAALQRGDKRIRFTIRPILHGNFFRFADNQPASLPLEAELAKLQEPDGAAINIGETEFDEFLAGKKSIHDFASKVHAGEVRFNLVTERPGDATISLSIWDKTGKIPLDHLTLTVQIANAAGGLNSGGQPEQTIPLRAGLGTLLDVSMDFNANGPLIADAAFYIFEPGPYHKSVVLFAADKAKEPGPHTGPAREVEVMAWETDSLLSQYIDYKTQLGILEKIRQARKLSENNQKYSYQDVAVELSKKIFTAYTEDDQRQATKAKNSFRDLVHRLNRAAIVFVRMQNEEGRPVYLPLGILAARSQNPVLEKRIVVVQPLPKERYPAATHPVEAWTFGVPKQLPELAPSYQDALRQLTSSTAPRFYRDIFDFRGFLESRAPATSEPRPEGILLLAHHADGNLWFGDKDQRIISEDIQHIFPAGSVAILSACSAAAAGGNNQAILEKLNNNGIDAMIISPFPVDANYGAMFAIQLIKTLDKAKTSPKGMTIAELFQKAAEKTAEHFKKKQDINFEEMSLEFLVAGDYRILLAPK
jgi:tetratricopeptide (TPR) repeat protein